MITGVGNSGREGGDNLQTFCKKYPTPTVSDSKNTDNASQKNRHEPGLSDCGGLLNPDWVEALMGMPVGWTDLAPLPAGTLAEWEGRYPADWRDGSWEIDLPRQTKRRQYRCARLRGIGNAWVPQSAVEAWRILSED